MRVDMIDLITRETLETEVLHTARRLDESATFTTQAHFFVARHDYAQAEPLYWHALRIKEEALGCNHREVAVCLEEIGELYEMRHLYSDARVLYERAVAIRSQILGARHPDVRRCARALRRLDSMAPTDGLVTNRELLCDNASLG